MCIGADEGCHEVPDPIPPIAIKFVSLDPTRMLMSLLFITNSGPIFIEPMPGIPSMPFIPPIWPGEGLAAGIGMFIFCSGEAAGICMPGMFIWVCGDAEGEVDGICICMPGMFICVCGDAEGEADGICIPGMFICIC